MDAVKQRLVDFLAKLPPFDSQAVLYAFIAGLIGGWIWFAFANSVRVDAIKQPRPEDMHSPRRYIFAAISQLAMTIMLSVLMKKLGETTMLGGIETALLIWFGFVLTTTLVNYANIGQRLTLTLVDALHWLIVLVISGVIIGLFSTVNGAATAPTAPAAATTAPATTTPATGSSTGTGG
jgi:uncharacterized membrane protein